MLQTTRDLENYVSRERYNLSKMRDNPNVPDSLLYTKVGHFNQLLSTLNNLFSVLMDVDEDLFTYFTIGDDDYAPIEVFDDVSNDTAGIRNDVDTDTGEIYSDANLDDSNDMTPMLDDERTDSDENDNEEHDDVYVEQEHDDVQVDPEVIDDGVDDEVSMRNADEMLTDYEQTSEQDITAYDPESDEPTEVLQHTVTDEENGDIDEHEVDEDTGRLLSEENIRYLNHTADDARVNDDPMQIADVVTGVEKHESEITGTDTDIKSLLSENNSLFDTEDIVKGDIDSLYISRDVRETDEENDEREINVQDEPADDHDEYEDNHEYDEDEHGVVSDDDFSIVDENETVEDEVQDEDDDREQYDEE